MKINNLLILGLFLVLGISSCYDNFEHSNERILGRWEFVKATKRPFNNFGSAESILEQYENDQIEFFDDNTLSYTNASDSGTIQTEGIWSFSEVTVEYSEVDQEDIGGETDYIVLTISMKNSAGEIVQYTWQMFGISHNRFNVKESQEDFEYRYTLKSLD